VSDPTAFGPSAARRVVLVAINLIVFVVLAEAVSLVIYYYDTGHLFYTYRRSYEPLPGERAGQLTGDALHPYFGPTHRPGLDFDIPAALRLPGRADATAPRTNNFGFVSPDDYPYARRSEDELIVGIFGGSVALWFCEVGRDRLLANLRSDPRFAGRPVVPLCFAHEGYKQPQQVLLLSYFLAVGQAFDVVVNIDGFNEVAIGRMNDERGMDVSMPSVLHLEPLVNILDQSTLTPAKIEVLANIARGREHIARLRERMRGVRFAAVNFVLEQFHAMAWRRYQADVGAFSALPPKPATSLVRVTPRLRVRAGPALFEDIARQWANASGQMHDLLAARGAAYVHVLQPNQYFTTRTFAPGEAAVAVNPESIFKAGAEAGYPLLVTQGTALQARGVRFFDGTHLFDEERAPVYMDDCCHYTLRGNEILADVVARGIRDSSSDVTGGRE
jgi:hypothetical protein